MKIKFWLPLSMLLSLSLNAQILDFKNMESVIPYLDNRTFEVPNYGFMTLHFDKKLYKDIQDDANSKNKEKVPTDVPFEVEIRRYNAKKSEGEYPLRVYPNVNQDLNQWEVKVKIGSENIGVTGASIIMSAKRSNAPEFFPTEFILLADGDLYFTKTEYVRLDFEEYKRRFLKMYEQIENPSMGGKFDDMNTNPMKVTLIKCKNQ